ncbi:MAG TPA: sugar ABC transporter permease [Thermomonospora sp.]|nr:sugar ABC transporter permease [Thermomonospora sp.]
MAVLTRARPAAQHRTASRPHRARGYWLFLLPGLVLFTVVVIVPFLMNVGYSFTRWPGVGDPEWIGLENYRRLLKDEVFWSSFRHNAALVIAMAVIPAILGLVLSALMFDLVARHFGGRTVTVLRAAYYLPQLLPIAVAGVVWGWMLHPQFGALNSVLDAVGLGSLGQDWLGDPDFALATVMAVMVWFQLGYPIVIFMAGLERVDPALHEAAAIDGATWLQRFRHITIPQLRPEIFVVLLTCTIAALKVFGPIYVLTRGGPGNATTVPSYFSFQNFFEKASVGYGSAVATTLAVIILVIAALFLRIQDRSS